MAEPEIKDLSFTENTEEPVTEPVTEPVLADPNLFDYENYERVSFSPEYVKQVTKIFKKQGSRKRVKGPDNKEMLLTPTSVLAAQGAEEFNQKTGMGTYQQFREGTAPFQLGYKFDDKQILAITTDLKDYGGLEGFLESAGRRAVENVPMSGAFALGFSKGKQIQSATPPVPKFPRTGIRPIDAIIGGAETSLTAGRFSIPYVTGIGSSILSYFPSQEFADLSLGEKKVATPDSYGTMRAGEAFADVLSFTPITLLADKAGTDVLTDYFTNRLTSGITKGKAKGENPFIREFDFSPTAQPSLSKQYKRAVQTSKTLGAKTIDGVKRPFQGPLTINDFTEQGVAAILQGKVAPSVLMKLKVIENALVSSGKQNKALTAFYESLAAGVSSQFVKTAAENDPYGFSEVIFEFTSALGTQVAAESLGSYVFKSLLPKVSVLARNIGDASFSESPLQAIGSGTYRTFQDARDSYKQNRGFKLILDELQRLGSIDSPEQLKAMIKRLEADRNVYSADGKPLTTEQGDLVQKTSGQMSEDPAIMAIEAALSRDIGSLSEQKQQALRLEKESLQAILENLAVGKNSTFSRASLQLAAEIRESIFTKVLDDRLTKAENVLLSAFEKVQKGGLSPGELKAMGLEDMSADDRLDLSVRLMDMLKQQKIIARNEQKRLYSKVGNVEVTSFFDDSGEIVTEPKFIRLLQEKGPFNDQSKVKNELLPLFKYAQQKAQELGLGVDLQVNNSKAIAHAEAYKSLTASSSRKSFDDFLLRENLSDPELQVTDDIIQKVRTERSKYKRKPEDDNLYSTYIQALIEKKDIQNPVALVQDGGITVQSLNQIRSDALSTARDGTKSPEVRSLAGQFASAIEDDIDNFATFGGDDLTQESLEALKIAKSFSKSFADVYYRSYVGDALQQTRDGAFRYAPETIAASFTGNRFDPNYLKIMDIEEVGKFARDNNLKGAQSGTDSITAVLDKILRNARAEVYDPETKTINEAKLKDWLNVNKRLEGTFPELFEDLRDLGKSADLFDNVSQLNSNVRNTINKQINFQSLLKDAKGNVRSNPTSAINEAFTAGKDQFQALENLIKVIPKEGETIKSTVYTFLDPVENIPIKFFNKTDAEKFRKKNPSFTYDGGKTLSVGREDAMEGLKSSIWEYFVLGTPSPKGQTQSTLNATKIYKELFEKKLVPSRNLGQRGARNRKALTVAEFLQKKGVFTNADIKGSKEVLETIMKIEGGATANMLGEGFAEAKPLIDFALAISGSAIGTKSQSILTGGQGGPGSIIAAGKGAEAMRNIFLKIPQSQKMLFTAELLQNPQLLAKMLRKYGDDGQSKSVINSLLDFMKKQGFVTTSTRGYTTITPLEIYEKDTSEKFDPIRDAPTKPPVVDYEAPAIPPVSDASPSMNAVRPAPLTVAQATPPAPPPAQADPQTRQKYAALFPNDPTSAMIKGSQGGIGSLFG